MRRAATGPRSLKYCEALPSCLNSSSWKFTGTLLDNTAPLILVMEFAHHLPKAIQFAQKLASPRDKESPFETSWKMYSSFMTNLMILGTAVLAVCVSVIAFQSWLLVKNGKEQPSNSSSAKRVERVAKTLSRTFTEVSFRTLPAPVQRAFAGVARRERKLRNINEYTVWFESRGVRPLVAPAVGRFHTPRREDLFVHTCPGGKPQMWIYNEDSKWIPVLPLFPHPRLAAYVLQLSDRRQPGWVTKETARRNIRNRA